MKKFTILIPIYNDWESLEKLLIKINENIKNIEGTKFNCVVIDDCSTIKSPDIKILSNINSIKIIHMKENRGHARCNAFGIKYLSKNTELDYVILMDGDGEDRPEEIKLLVGKVLLEPDTSVVAKRVKRSEGFLFQSLYYIHKYLTLITTGKLINFGNYSCLTKADLKILSTKASLWSSFSGSLKKYIKKYNEINSFRGMRYFGPSQMSLFKLIVHSLSIIAVFKYRVFLISFVLILLSEYLAILTNSNFLFFRIVLILFNLFVFIVSFRESETKLKNSELNIKNTEEFTH
jgi:glycosyltransferase involved in cell wall biosynthesis|tara:strand:+ start:800 stop:1672 length:873 start_codon:yes stop_codon:yes gene_type:complete